MIGNIDIDMALMRVLKQRFQLGMFDPPEQQPWSTVPMDVVGSQRHHELAVEAVRRGWSSFCSGQWSTLFMSLLAGRPSEIHPALNDFECVS